MKRLGLSRGIAAIAMLLGNPGILGGAEILPLSNHHQRKRAEPSLSTLFNRQSSHQGRCGPKERARFANRADGPMHRSPNIVQSNDWKRAQAASLEAIRAEPKPARKPRAKKAA